MSNALTIQNKPSFLVTVPQRDTSEFSLGLGGGMPIPSLSFRGKVFRMRLDGSEVSTKKSELDLVLVASRPNLSKRYYTESYTGADEGGPPTCSSTDGVTPDTADPVHDNCARCPKNAWGSSEKAGGSGKGKACGDYKRLVVYPVGLAKGDMRPSACVLDVPATSLHAPKGSQEIMLREYLRVLGKNGIDPMTYVATVSFTDAEFPQLVFKPARYVTEAEYAVLKEMRDSDDVQDVLFGGAAPPIKGENPVPAPKEAAPAPQPAPEKPKAEKPKAPKPEKPKPAPVKVAEPEEVQEEAAEDDDAALLDELRALAGK